MLDRDVGVALKRLLDPVAAATDACKEIKHLHPNTTLTELRQVSLNFCQPNVVPSYGTFVRCYHGTWSKCVRFRMQSQHAKCNDCERFKAWRRTAATAQDVAMVGRAYLEHVGAVIADRRADTLWRQGAKMSMTTGQMCLEDGDAPGWLSITVDGMDISKFAVPLNIAKSKEFAAMERPQLKLTLGMSDGHEEAYFLQHPTMIGSANVDLTILADMIASSFDEANQRGIPWPRGLKVHADNATAEIRNQTTLKFGAWLVHNRIFDRFAATFYRVGHSHGAPDQRFAELRHHLLGESVLECPADFMAAIGKVQPRGGRAMRVQMLEHIFDFTAYFEALGVAVSGHTGTKGKHERKEHPAHVFQLMTRETLEHYYLDELTIDVEDSFEDPARGGDIMMLCKGFLANTCFFHCQRFCPEGNFEAVQAQGLPVCKHGQRQLGSDQIKDLKKTIAIVSQAPWRYTQAAAYIQKLIDFDFPMIQHPFLLCHAQTVLES